MTAVTPDPPECAVSLQPEADEPALPHALTRMLATCLQQVRSLELSDLAEVTHEGTHDPRWHD